MLVFNVSRVLALRGIDKPFAYLVKRGLTRSVAYNLLNYQASNLKIAHLEKLCRALNCTPNDLFEWQTDEADALGENHSLNSLKRAKNTPNLKKIINEVPMEKLDRVEAFFNELKKEQ